MPMCKLRTMNARLKELERLVLDARLSLAYLVKEELELKAKLRVEFKARNRAKLKERIGRTVGL